MQSVITVLLVLVGLINFLPVMGLQSQRLNSLYAVEISDSNLLMLMQHRALLFGIVGLFILIAAFRSAMQPAAFIMAFVSMVGYILIVRMHGNYNEALAKVMMVDIVGLVLLLTAIVLYVIQTGNKTAS